MENTESINLMSKRQIKAIFIMAFSLGGVFFSGYYFNLFGTKIDFTNNPYVILFYGFIALGIYGVLYTFLTSKAAIKGTVFFVGVFMLIYIAGRMSRGEL